MDAYARLVEMCEREAELIAAADWDAVVALGDERAVLVGSLPAKPPPEHAPICAGPTI